MINNYEEKLYIGKQVNILENILLSLKTKLLPKREEQYKAMAAVYVRKIREFREQLDEYTGIELFNIKKADINIHIEGPMINYGSAPISIISLYLNNFKKTMQNIYTDINKINYKRRLPKFISDLCDFHLSDLQPGSINLSLSYPSSQTCFIESNSAEKSVDTYFNILKWIYFDDDIYIKDIDDDMKEKLLINMIRTLPDDKVINKITFYGSALKSEEKIIVNKSTKQKIIKILNRDENNIKKVAIKGCIRELDLDKLTFMLRNVEEYHKSEVKCKITTDKIEDLKEYLNTKVIINGIEKDNSIVVKFIEVLDTE